MRPGLLLWVVFAGGSVFGAACASNAGAPTISPGPSVTPSSAERLLPPFEGPEREGVLERQDWSQDPDWQLPSPADLPTPAPASDPVLHPSPLGACPTDWETLDRPVEGFSICHPSTWTVARQGNVSEPNEDPWYAAGIFDFPTTAQTHQRGHVSVYVIPKFTQPPRYTIDCDQAYAVQFAGRDAVLCPTFAATSPEARIISYHVAANDLDYFVNIATYYDTTSSPYPTAAPTETLATALQIVGTFRLATPITEDTGSAAASATPIASATQTTSSTSFVTPTPPASSATS